MTNDLLLEDALEARAAYTAGLRAIADLLDANESLPLPHDGTTSAFAIFARSREELLAYRRLMGESARHSLSHDSNYGFRLTGNIEGLLVLIYAQLEIAGTQSGVQTVPVYELDPELVCS